MSKINNLFKKLDYLGPSFHITFQGEQRKKSFIGACITSIILVILVTGLSLIGQEIIYKEKPYLAVSEYFSKEGTIKIESLSPNVIYSDTSGRIFAHSSPFFDAIETSFELYEIILENNVFKNTYYRASSRLCTLEDFQKNPNNENTCKDGICNVAFCLDENKITDLTGKPAKKDFYLNNEYGQLGSAFVQIKTQLCNEKLKPGCRAGLKGINSFMANYFYLQNSLDITKYKSPINTFQQGHMSQISVEMFRRDFIHLQMAELETDSGIILSNINSENYYNTKSKSNFTLLYSETNRNIYGVNFDISSNKLTVKRQYMKVQELIASIGGFFKALMVAGSVLISEYSEFQFYNHFVASSKIQKFNRRTNQVVRFDRANKNSVSSQNNINMAISQQPLVNVSFWQYLLHKIGKNSAYVDSKSVHDLFDINHLASRLKELELLVEHHPSNDSNQIKQ